MANVKIRNASRFLRGINKATVAVEDVPAIEEKIKLIILELQKIEAEMVTTENVDEIVSEQVEEKMGDYATIEFVDDKKATMVIDNMTYIVTYTDINGNISTIDLPLEEMIVSGSYSNGYIILTLRSGNVISFPVSDIVSGLATETWVEEHYQEKGDYIVEGDERLSDARTPKPHTHSYNDLEDKPTIPSIEGLATEEYVNNHHDSTKQDTITDLETIRSGAEKGASSLQEETDPTVPSHVKNITETDIQNWNNKSDFSGDYNDLENKPNIPSITPNPEGEPEEMLSKVEIEGKIYGLAASGSDCGLSIVDGLICCTWEEEEPTEEGGTD